VPDVPGSAIAPPQVLRFCHPRIDLGCQALGPSEPPRCLVPGFDGAFLSREWREALRAKFSTAAPLRCCDHLQARHRKHSPGAGADGRPAWPLSGIPRLLRANLRSRSGGAVRTGLPIGKMSSVVAIPKQGARKERLDSRSSARSARLSEDGSHIVPSPLPVIVRPTSRCPLLEHFQDD
jgi:hypothetical protein